MRRLGIVGLLVGLLLLGGVALGAYQLGLTAGATAAAVEAGATVVVPGHWGVGFGGFPLVGFFFGFLFLVLLIGFIARMASWGRGGSGPMAGPWTGRGPGGRPGAWSQGRPTPPPHVDAWLRGWHDGAHAAPGSRTHDGGTAAETDRSPDARA